jgi:hypothetical protein
MREKISGESFAGRLATLDRLSGNALLNLAIAQGEKINHVTDWFKCYDVALELKTDGRKLTKRQRSAIKNVLALYLERGIGKGRNA